jgi:hypothetical protein
MIVEAKLKFDGARVGVANICDTCDLVAKLGQNPRYAAFSGRFWPKPSLDDPGAACGYQQGAPAGES